MKLSNNLSPEQLLQQSQSLQQAGQFEEAAIGFEKLRKLYPTYPPILNSLGIVYLQLGKFKDGCKLLEKSLQLDPKQAMVFYNLGRAYQNQGQFNDAIAAYKRALKIDPHFKEGYESLGILLHNQGIFDEAAKCFDNMIVAYPNHAGAYNGRGISLYALGLYEEALISLKAAVTINAQAPEVHNNLGLTFHKLNRIDQAIHHYNLALQVNPNYADAYSNRGLSFQALKKTAEASNDFNHCLDILPNHADANWNKALIKLSLGDYEEGWRLYEWRWKSFSKKWARHYKQPVWLGEEPIEGKSILIYPEQGYGDFIQFYRYIPKLQALGAKVILETPGPLINLISGSSTEIKLIEAGQTSPQFDVQCPIMSLPLAFKTNLGNIPNTFPYLSTSDEKNTQWENLLGARTRKRIGIAWSGSREHKNDHNRSIALTELSPLFTMSFEFHSLQKEIRETDQAFFDNSNIVNHQDNIHDFSDTAALISHMDLVITVDTAIAHLAGSLNKKVLILIPSISDYRWMFDRNDSPWYPTATLFRQKELGHWKETIFDIKNKLSENVNSIAYTEM